MRTCRNAEMQKCETYEMLGIARLPKCIYADSLAPLWDCIRMSGAVTSGAAARRIRFRATKFRNAKIVMRTCRNAEMQKCDSHEMPGIVRIPKCRYAQSLAPLWDCLRMSEGETSGAAARPIRIGATKFRNAEIVKRTCQNAVMQKCEGHEMQGIARIPKCRYAQSLVPLWNCLRMSGGGDKRSRRAPSSDLRHEIQKRRKHTAGMRKNYKKNKQKRRNTELL